MAQNTTIKFPRVVWHQGATNTHLTPGGEQVLADAIHESIF